MERTVDVKQKKNLLIIIPHLSRGGAERSAAKLSALLHEEFNLYIVTFFDAKLFNKPYPHKGELHSLNQKQTNSRIRKVINTIQRIIFLRKFKKKYRIDATVSYLFNADMANILSKRNDKVIISIRTHLSTSKRASAQKKKMKKLYPKADQVIVQNKRGLEDLSENFGVQKEKIHVIPNFYDLEQIQQQAEHSISEWENTQQYLKLIQLGRLSDPKGQWHLLRIFKHTLAKIPQARLIIIGAGELKEYLIKYATTLDISVQDLCESEEKTPDFEKYQVVLHGFSSNPFKYLKAADLFLFTSIYEGFPNALAEAMICGSIVMSTDCPIGPKELIDPDMTDIDTYPVYTEYGALFPAFKGEKIPADAPMLEEEQLWVDALIQYSKNKASMQKMGVKAQKRMKEYDKKTVFYTWMEILSA